MLKEIFKKTTNDNLNKLKKEIKNTIKEFIDFYEIEDEEIFEDIENTFSNYYFK